MKPRTSISTSSPSLTTPHRRARRAIRPTPAVNVDLEPGVRVLVRAWKTHQRAGRPAPAARHAELRARNVQLRAVDLARAVQRNVLDAQQVLAAGRVLGDGDGEGGLVERGPRELAPGGRRLLGVDLEPDLPGAVPRGGGLAGGDSGERVSAEEGEEGKEGRTWPCRIGSGRGGTRLVRL